MLPQRLNEANSLCLLPVESVPWLLRFRCPAGGLLALSSTFSLATSTATATAATPSSSPTTATSSKGYVSQKLHGYTWPKGQVGRHYQGKDGCVGVIDADGNVLFSR
jgi:hypothetical protein